MQTRGIQAAAMINPAGQIVQEGTDTLRSALTDYISANPNPTFSSLLMRTLVHSPPLARCTIVDVRYARTQNRER
jgi:hypothetical protein